ncbi:NAD-dependent epimerase/dehydratase family protein, partial [Candidatus Pelagibacter sp.]|nr:NAD-dependent epimerase/dehydratase family protein [Candidatus Pelagibacter sp.]
MKNIIVITGGAGFVGSHLIELLLLKTNKSIISLDNYSSGTTKNHIKNSRVKYLKGHTYQIEKLLKNRKSKIHSLFHFGEFARIYQSFKNFDKCFKSNSIGTQAVFKFCLDNKIKLIYSATSASLGNGGKDKNLSPYAFSKSKNLEMLENLKKWFKMKFEIIYFYNVYGPRQIQKGEMATVIGIFENQIKNNQALTIVKPGTQSRRFTHIYDTV